jgi:hypothetical protein
VLVTRTFAGKVVGSYQYLFFVLYEDYSDFKRAFIKEFNDVYLERLARRLEGRGAVLVPFVGDIERSREEVMDKDWTDAELKQLRKVPALLVISRDFDDFSPRSDPWVIFYFGEEQYGGPAGLAELDKTLKAIADSVVSSDGNSQTLYQIARRVTSERPDVGLIFSLQPNVFGFSIDLIKAGSYLRALLQSIRRPVGHEFGVPEAQ